MLTVALPLAAAAFAAGVAGTWSPCGFSMIESIGPAGHDRGLPATLAACAAFAAGALAGGLVLFELLAALGSLTRVAGGRPALLLAAALTVCGAVADGTGARVRPQIRKQVPESWRRRFPIVLAAGLYGVLLGLGFTTFVLSVGTWVLAGVVVALGSPAVALAVGLGFGAGRALPVAVLAPMADGARGVHALDAMAQRSSALRLTRLAVAAALAVSGALLLGEPTQAAESDVSPASDPTVAGSDLAWNVPGTGGFLLRGGQTIRLPGSGPALGGRYAAWHDGDVVTVADRTTLQPVRTFNLAGVDELAVSDGWLVVRQRRPGGGDRLAALSLDDPLTYRFIASVKAPTQLGRPAIDGTLAAYHRASTTSSSLVLINLVNGERWVFRTAQRAELLNPSIRGGYVLFVRVTACFQELRLERLTASGGRILLRTPNPVVRDLGRERGHTAQGRLALCPSGPTPRRRLLWTTALSSRTAYITTISAAGGAARPSLLRVRR